MPDPESSRRAKITDRLSALTPLALAVVGVAVVALVGGGGYYVYRTYDYVQHDNDFCMSCHLMEEPFEAFAASPHQGLGCKACHQPNLLERSQMGLVAVLEDPDAVGVHAAVPNERCAACHVEGDPEKWRLVSNTAGHRVHLESDDPNLIGLQCVECHSTSIHSFSPIDRTCAQSGCHDDKAVQLGTMSSLTIHCASCHNFVAPIEEGVGILANAVDAAVLPDQDECLSCHVMRTLARMPEHDPHMGGCAACHNPHEQDEASDAASSCASAGCHEDPSEESPWHRGLEVQVVADCLNCHQAHDFSLQGGDCGSCHVAMVPVDPATMARFEAGFTHQRHETVACASCHSTGDTHGSVALTAIEDCRTCHHTAPVSAECADCHDAADGPDATYRFVRAVEFTVGTSDPARTMTFSHPQHAGLDCGSCHTEGLGLETLPDFDCAGCHREHHTPESDCAACHKVAPVSAHPPAQGHVTCSGAGCHVDVPFKELPRTRAFCLGCHQDLRGHEPDRSCEDCHSLPEPRPGAGGHR